MAMENPLRLKGHLTGDGWLIIDAFLQHGGSNAVLRRTVFGLR
jgi:hypothetical protein